MAVVVLWLRVFSAIASCRVVVRAFHRREIERDWHAMIHKSVSLTLHACACRCHSIQCRLCPCLWLSDVYQPFGARRNDRETHSKWQLQKSHSMQWPVMRQRNNKNINAPHTRASRRCTKRQQRRRTRERKKIIWKWHVIVERRFRSLSVSKMKSEQQRFDGLFSFVSLPASASLFSIIQPWSLCCAMPVYDVVNEWLTIYSI